MTSRNLDPTTPEAPGAWHSTLDGWVVETMLSALRRVDAAVLEWCELPLWEHSEPTANVNLGTDSDLVRSQKSACTCAMVGWVNRAGFAGGVGL